MAERRCALPPCWQDGAAIMASTQRFILKASADAAENVRSNKRAIRQIDESCAASRRELDSSYELLRRVRQSLGEPLAPRTIEGRPTEEGRSFDPKAVAVLLEAFRGVVVELGLREPAEQEMAAKCVIRVARDQTDLDAVRLRDGAISSMVSEGKAVHAVFRPTRPPSPAPRYRASA